ncbi:MAG: pyrimidine-nucleoside phosphorylase [Firmicutes bacterium]|nr:pyrimidine-nucleoside phosphorylase [Bacillota bacterium]
MRAYDIIAKKRDGHELSGDEIKFIVNGFVAGDIPDYQMAAFLMAVFIRGMSPKETSELTLCMAKSGDQIDLSAIKGIKVDKHSTGGVGDKTTIALGPMVAACGAPVAKMSGRALGFAGGTIDKLESIPGFNVALSMEQFVANVNRIGIALSGQTGNLAPADKKIYALRDVTATIDSVPLIAASIMSKKIASGADAIVLDVKTGKGSFMKSLDDAFNLASTMVAIGTEVGRKVVAVITDMSQPLGYAVGNALEVKEAIATLKGEGPGDFYELCVTLGGHMLTLAGKTADFEDGRAKIKEAVTSGRALDKLRELLEAQGANPTVADNPEMLPDAALKVPVTSDRSGFVKAIDAEEIGRASMMLGAGREKKEDAIDYSVGVVLLKKMGDRVASGEPIAVVHANDRGKAERAVDQIKSSFSISKEPVSPTPLIHGMVTAEGITR